MIIATERGPSIRNAGGRDPASTAATHWFTQASDAMDLIEVQSAVLVRNFELLRRRGELYGELDRAGYLLLRVLEAIGPADINTLAAAVGLDPSTAGRQVAAMLQAGLIERQPDPADRRRSIVTPTAEGRGRADRVRQLRRDMLDGLLDGWSEQEMRSVGEGFARFNQAIAEHYLGAPDEPPATEPPATEPPAGGPTDGDPPAGEPASAPVPTRPAGQKTSPTRRPRSANRTEDTSPLNRKENPHHGQ
ncbi:hypothetical protein GCM10023322_64850 [Rugosimonospora acidiphila]|uniref:HTH marR-type domain-containing protein n=1 Tax=Rugosimonospora acidiphila TaxID=556531 RepID=A0ABP9SKI8_9ACTN